MKNVNFYLLAIIIFLSSCSGSQLDSELELDSPPGNNNPPSKVVISIDSIKSNTANISWTKSSDTENDSISYDLVLNGVTILKDYNKRTLKIENLTELTDYNGKILARDTKNNFSETLFNFRTLKNYIKFKKKYYFNVNSNYNSGLLPKKIIKLSDGYLIGGYIGLVNGASFFLVKIDHAGNLIWKKFYTKSFYSGVEEFKMKKTNDDNVIVLGANFLFKVDRNGNQIWNKTFYQFESLHGQITSFDIDSDNNIFLVGYRQIERNKDQSGYLTKLDNNGNLIWEKGYYDSIHYQYFNDIIIDNEKLLILGKVKADISGQENLYYLRTDKEGDKEVAKTYNYSCGSVFVKGLIKRKNGNYLLFGSDICHSYATITSEINSSGIVIWQKKHSIGYINSLKETPEGNLVMTGFNNVSSYNMRMFFYLINNIGDKVWHKDIYEMANYYYGEEVIPEDDGGFVFLTRHSLNHVVNPEDNGEIIIYKTDPDGNYK